VRGLVRTNLSMPAFGVVSEITNNTGPGQPNFCTKNPGVCQNMIVGDPLQTLMSQTISPPAAAAPDGAPIIPSSPNNNSSAYNYWTANPSLNASALTHIKLCLPSSDPSSPFYKSSSILGTPAQDLSS
jgi:hypothetical protein